MAKKVLGEIVESASNTVMITAKEKERIKCAEISGSGFSKIKLKALCKYYIMANSPCYIESFNSR